MAFEREDVGAKHARALSSPQHQIPEPRRSESSQRAVQRRGETVANEYRIERLIAQGEMGSVYLATQLTLNRRVALKVLPAGREDPTFEQRFFLEASAYARLEHRHVVTVHDFGRTETGELYIAMEFLRGTLLSERLQREGRFELFRAIDITAQLAWGLRAAHRRGIIHRDLKLSNVMLLEDGDTDGRDFAKLLDFGIAKVMETTPRSRRDGNLTQKGTWVGSPGYMSPEQVRCGHVDARSDIYSFGIVLFELCTGHHPFHGRGTANLLRWHLTGTMPHLRASQPGLPDVKNVDAVIHRCVKKDPSDRFQSMDALIEALGRCQGTKPLYPPGDYGTVTSVVRQGEPMQTLDLTEAGPDRGVSTKTFPDRQVRRSQVSMMAEKARDEAALRRIFLWIAVLAIPLSALIVFMLVADN